MAKVVETDIPVAVPAEELPPPPPYDIADPKNVNTLQTLGFPPGLARMTVEETNTRIAQRVFVLDDSGSMRSSDAQKFVNNRLQQCSRWEELVDMAVRQAHISVACGVPATFIVMNRKMQITVTTSSDVHNLHRELQSVTPRGSTPLSQCLQSVIEFISSSSAELDSSGRLVSVCLVTDGLPTFPNTFVTSDEAKEELKQTLIQMCMTLPVVVVARLCTDEEGIVGYWNGLDQEAELSLDVIDDAESEAGEIREQGNDFMVYTLPLHWCREGGSTCAILDKLDEQRLTVPEAAKMVERLVSDGGDFPSYEDPDTFLSALTSVPQVFDPVSKEMKPCVDIEKLAELMRA